MSTAPASSPEAVQRCVRCLLPRTEGGYEFNAAGECRLCQEAKLRPQNDEAARAARRARLEASLEELRRRGKGREFDCVVGISGGRDSTYLLHQLVRKHNLRCLAAYYRTPFTVDEVDANVQRLVKNLNVKMVPMDIDPNYHARKARELVLLWNRKPMTVIGNLTCAPCKLVNRESHRIAWRYGVKGIVYGGNRHEMFHLSAGQLKEVNLAKKHSMKIQALEALTYAKRGFGMMAKSMAIWKYAPMGFWAAVMYRCPHTVYLRLRFPGIYRMEYFYQAEWDEEECRQALRDVGWVRPSDCFSDWKADCSFAEWKNYMYVNTHGVHYVEALLSNMVREGLLTREEGLRRLAIETQPSEGRWKDIERVLGLSREEMTRHKRTTGSAG